MGAFGLVWYVFCAASCLHRRICFSRRPDLVKVVADKGRRFTVLPGIN